MRDKSLELDNTRVSKPFIVKKVKLTPELLRKIQADKYIEYIKKNQAVVYDASKAKYYKDLQNFYNLNAFGYGISGNLTRFDPSTSEGQAAIQSNYNYSKDNAINFMSEFAGAGATSTIIGSARKIRQIFGGPFKLVSTRGSLGTMKQYTKNGVIGGGSEAVVIKNTPTTVGKITTIPVEEMTTRNAIPNTVQSKYIGFVKDNKVKLPTYILKKVKVLTEKTFPKYVSKLDKAMQNSGYKIVNDPNVLYRAYTNGTIVIDDVAPGNVGLNWFGKPKMIDFNMQTVPEWIALGFKLQKGGKVSLTKLDKDLLWKLREEYGADKSKQEYFDYWDFLKGSLDAQNYFNSYLNSPGFQRIINNQNAWWKSRHPYYKWVSNPDKGTKKWFEIAKLTVPNFYTNESYTNLSTTHQLPEENLRIIVVGRRESEFPYNFVIGHEYLHGKSPFGILGTPTFNERSAQGEALKMNKNTKEGHDSLEDEKHADIWGLKYLFYKEGIYDSRGKKDINLKLVKLLRDKYPELRPFKQMDDKLIMFMMNNVAINESLQDLTKISLIKKGGKL